MKKIILLLLLANIAVFVQGQTTSPFDCGLTYFYDANGNRIIRMIVPCNGGTSRLRNVDSTQTSNNDVSTGLKDDTLSNFQIVLMAPNPTGGPFKITCNQDLVNANISIVDIQGKIVSQSTVNGMEIPLDISHLAVGSYSVVVTTNTGRTGGTIVKNSQR